MLLNTLRRCLSALTPLTPFTPICAMAALALLPTQALAGGAGVGSHTTLASFQANIRGNSISDTFNGPDDPNIPSYAISGSGFAATLDVSNPAFGLTRIGNRMGSASPLEGTTFTFTGRPVSAFAADVVLLNLALATVGGNLSVVTDTGETFTVAIPVAGAFVGITASRPFTALTINTDPPSATTFEFMDNAFIGIAANAPELTDQCADAETINPITAVQYAFTTVGTGATTTAISGSCATIDSGADIWVRFVSTVYGNITINTCGANFDTILRVFENCGPAGNGVGATQIVCNDDFCTGGAGALASQVQFRAEAGEDYLVRISGFAGATGSGNLFFSVVPDCQADINHSGGIGTVQDIFDFLAAYFGGC